MNRINAVMLGLLLVTILSVPAMAQQKPAKATDNKKMMTWTTKSKEADALAKKGSDYFLNIEHPQAYDCFTKALQLDPNFTVPLVFMSFMTIGETKKAFADRALKSAANKTEGEKLFATLVDAKGTEESRREVWTKLHEMFPDGAMIGTGYVNSRATPDERLAAAQEYLQKFPDRPWMYNTLGYIYMLDKKDNEMARKNFEKYIQMYPEGYNPYDSMGEFYLTTGDQANAEKYYTKALEKYPFSNSSVVALEKIKEEKKKATAGGEKKD
jgi:tetratricopeptide (TPR) repeat protein